MEPITIASAFASVVGLLSVFKGEVDARESKTLAQYVEWLRRHDHKQLVELISGNRDLGLGIQSLLDGQHEQVMAKLSELDEVLAGVARRFDGFEVLASAVQVREMLSDQAVSILRQMNEFEASTIIKIGHQFGCEYAATDGTRARLEFTDERFIPADLETLCGLGLLISDVGSKGSDLYRITREGAAVGRENH